MRKCTLLYIYHARLVFLNGLGVATAVGIEPRDRSARESSHKKVNRLGQRAWSISMSNALAVVGVNELNVLPGKLRERTSTHAVGSYHQEPRILVRDEMKRDM